MELENLKDVLVILNNALKDNDFGEDNQRIKKLHNSLKNFYQELPTIIEMDKLEKEINYLEIKYDIFNELSYYFDPLYIKIKNKIHEIEIKKLREETRKKRGIK